MGLIVRTGLLAGLVMLAAAQPAFAETRINCPLQKAKRTITDTLPNGWWTTPIVDRLSQTRVMKIAGKPALMCIYGNAGSIQRNAPANQSCRAVTGGFVCSGGAPAPTVQVQPKVQPTAPLQAKPVTYSTGRLSVPQTHTFDIDRGGVGKGAADDMWFQAKTAKDLYLTPRNGAKMSVSGKRNRGLAGCRTARYSAGATPLARLPVGTYICVRTNEGRIAEFRINGISGSGAKTLSLGYTTWK